MNKQKINFQKNYLSDYLNNKLINFTSNINANTSLEEYETAFKAELPYPLSFLMNSKKEKTTLQKSSIFPQGQEIVKTVIIEFTGEPKLFFLAPNKTNYNFPTGTLTGNNVLTIEIIHQDSGNDESNKKEINIQMNEAISNFELYFLWQKEDIDKFYEEVKNKISILYNHKKKEAERLKNL